MTTRIGTIEALLRYPVKSMAGERIESAALGWHGLEGDRRFALRRVGDTGGFPWLSASRLAELVRFQPERPAGAPPDAHPTHVRTPEGAELPILGDALAAEIARRLGAPVEMMHFKHGVQDEAHVSVIAMDTVDDIARQAGVPADARRFRPNVLIRPVDARPFVEDDWVGGTLTFGEGDDAAAVAITQRDIRCAMLNLDPDTAAVDPRVLKAVVGMHGNTAGVYGAVVRAGRLADGAGVYFARRSR